MMGSRCETLWDYTTLNWRYAQILAMYDISAGTNDWSPTAWRNRNDWHVSTMKQSRGHQNHIQVWLSSNIGKGTETVCSVQRFAFNTNSHIFCSLSNRDCGNNFLNFWNLSKIKSAEFTLTVNYFFIVYMAAIAISARKWFTSIML